MWQLMPRTVSEIPAGAGGVAWDPSGAEGAIAESSGPRRRHGKGRVLREEKPVLAGLGRAGEMPRLGSRRVRTVSTSGWLGDRIREKRNHSPLHLQLAVMDRTIAKVEI